MGSKISFDLAFRISKKKYEQTEMEIIRKRRFRNNVSSKPSRSSNHILANIQCKITKQNKTKKQKKKREQGRKL